MKIGETFYAPSRRAWHAWLLRNRARKSEIWLIYYKKASGKPRVSYNDAVDEALCFGWIDSTAKAIDEERFAQRFTPRRSNSQLSQLNQERILKLISEWRMTAAGLAAVSHVFNHRKLRKFVIAKDILNAIKANPAAWKYFLLLPERYKRIRISYIESQRRHSHAAFNKSLNYFIKKTAVNKRFGFVRD